MRRDLLQLLLQILNRKIDRSASNGGAAASERSDAGGDSSRITVERNHIFRFDPEFIRDDLCKRSFLALAVRRGSRQDSDLARAFNSHGTGFPAAAGQNRR